MSSMRSKVPQAIRADLEVAYKEGRKVGAGQEYKKILMMERTSSDSKLVTFYGGRGKLRRFRDERQPQSFEEYKYATHLDDWEMTRTVDRNVLDDDQSGGIVRTRVKNFGLAVDQSLEQETWENLRLGSSRKGFDKQELFSLNHRYYSSSGVTVNTTDQPNMHMGNSQLDSTTMKAIDLHFSTLKNDKGRPWGGALTHVLVRKGSANHHAAKELANSQFTVESSTAKGQMAVNTFEGAFGIIPVNYGLGISSNNTSEWMALDLSDPEVRPMVMLTHSVSPGFANMEYTQLLNDSETGFWRNKLAFGVFGRFDWNVGDWRSAFLMGSSNHSLSISDYENQAQGDPNA